MTKSKPVDPCQKEACQIQACLQANNYKEARCEHVLQAMRKCCEKYQAESSCCAGFKPQTTTSKS